MSNTLEKRDRKMFVFSVLFLTGGNILVKLVGLLFKIPLQRILGDLGMAYFNKAYSIYSFLFLISTTGLPVAVSRLVAARRTHGDLKGARRIFRLSASVFFIVGLVLSAAMFFGSGLFASLNGTKESVYCIMAIAPTLLLICISSAFRGYFHGFQRMGPSAVSQIIEAIGKCAIGIILAAYAKEQGKSLPVVAAYAIFGVTVGVLAGMFFLIVTDFLYTKKNVWTVFGTPEETEELTESNRSIISSVVRIAIPVSISSSVLSLTSLIDTGLITHRLEAAGIALTEADTMYGNYTTLAVPIANLPPVLIYPIASAIVPLLAAMLASRDGDGAKKIMESSMKLTSLISIPCALGISVLSYPILALLFPEESARRAAPLLSILAISIFFNGITSVSSAVLQSIKKERLPIISMGVGAVVKIVSSYVLVGIPAVNIYGTPISSLLCCLAAAACNLYFVAKHAKLKPSVSHTFVRPLVAGTVCAATAYGAYAVLSRITGNGVSALLSIALAALVYVVCVFAIRCITKDDIMILPRGEKVYSLLNRAHLVK